MKKNLIISIAVLIVLLLSSICYAEIHSLRIGGDVYYPPYEYLDENGVYKGFNVDITNALSIELGIDIELEPMDWDNALDMLRRGELDAVQGITVSESREEDFDFSRELLSNSQVIFVRKENEFIKSVQDLRGQRVAIQSDDIVYEEISNVEGVYLTKYATQNAGIKALIEGSVDAFVGNRLTGLYYIQKNKHHDKVKISGEILKTTSYAMAVKSGDLETLNLLNEGLIALEENGTYQKIYEKWFGEYIYDFGKWKNLFWVTSAILLSTLVLVIFMITLNRFLKKEVSKRTEEISIQKSELAKKDRLKGMIIENVNVGIMAFDIDGYVTNINDFSNEILGTDLKEGSPFTELSFLDCSDFDFVKRSMLKGSLEDELDYYNGENQRTIRYKLLPISNENKLEGLLLCIFDMTEERRMSEVLAHTDKMQSLGVLSAGIAHEIRNPLTSIKMFVDLLPSKHASDDFLNKFMSIVPSELSRLNHLTSSLLDYSKTSEPNLECILLKDIVDDVLLLIEPYLNKKKVVISKKLEDASLLIDRSQIKQVLLNVILNSIDSFKESGQIDILSAVKGDSVHISIQDDGEGISTLNLDKVFNPFFTSKKEGNGIGLPISKNLIKENHGTMSIKSSIGIGTTVTIVFPIYKQV